MFKDQNVINVRLKIFANESSHFHIVNNQGLIDTNLMIFFTMNNNWSNCQNYIHNGRVSVHLNFVMRYNILIKMYIILKSCLKIF